jgi:hypothetical protein
LSKRPCILKGGEEKEIGIVLESNITLGIRTFEDLQVDNWGRINWTSVGGGYIVLAKKPR